MLQRTPHSRATIITDYDQIGPLVEHYHRQGKRIVLTQGSFDMIHIGHGRYCREAKQHGDVLFVGVDSDEKIRQRKGPDRPVVPEVERMEMLTYLDSVDHVVLKRLDQPKWELIRRIHPDVLIATQETYSPDQLDALKELCGAVVVLEPMATTSTSAKIRLVQMGAAKKIGSTLNTTVIATIEKVLAELRDQQ